jgi:GT2 family glycosyltransferase
MIIYTVIVTFNGMQWIERCISSLLESVLPTHILIIDNLSTDGTPEFIEQHFPQAELIRSELNLGFGKGNNIGMQKALEVAVDYVFLLNQDAWIKPDTLEVLVNAHRQNNQFGIISPVHLNGQENGLENKFAEYAGQDNTPGLIADFYHGKYKTIYESKFVNAAAWLISCACLRDVGGFDPIFPHYCEDIYYINRCRFYNYKVGIVPSCTVVHDSKKYSWDDIKYNKTLRVNFHVVELKNLSSTFRSSLALFLKKEFDTFTSNILFRRFKDVYFNFSVLFKVLGNIQRVRSSRKITSQKQAFL